MKTFTCEITQNVWKLKIVFAILHRAFTYRQKRFFGVKFSLAVNPLEVNKWVKRKLCGLFSTHQFTSMTPFFTGLPLFWTSASKRGFELSDVVRLLSKRTAQLCGLDGLKGNLAPGYDADLVIWDPERSFQVSQKNHLQQYSSCVVLHCLINRNQNPNQNLAYHI